MYISITKQSDMSVHNTVSVLYTAYPVNLKLVSPFLHYLYTFVLYYSHSITYMQMQSQICLNGHNNQKTQNTNTYSIAPCFGWASDYTEYKQHCSMFRMGSEKTNEM